MALQYVLRRANGYFVDASYGFDRFGEGAFLTPLPSRRLHKTHSPKYYQACAWFHAVVTMMWWANGLWGRHVKLQNGGDAGGERPDVTVETLFVR